MAQDQYVQLLPGLGHTGSEPFDDVHGWYRSYRGLAGSIKYHSTWKGWSPFEHHQFPKHLQDAVLTMLLANNRRYNALTSSSSSGSDWISQEVQNLISVLPKYVVYHIMEFAVSRILLPKCFVKSSKLP